MTVATEEEKKVGNGGRVRRKKPVDKRGVKWTFADPFSKSLAYFFNRVAPFDQKQIDLFSDYTLRPDLRDSHVGIDIDEDGDVIGFYVVDGKEEEYENLRKLPPPKP